MAKQLRIWIKAISDDQLIVLFSYVTYFASLYTGARFFLHCNLSCHYTKWILSLCSLTSFVKNNKALNMTKLGKSQLILICSSDSYFKMLPKLTLTTGYEVSQLFQSSQKYFYSLLMYFPAFSLLFPFLNWYKMLCWKWNKYQLKQETFKQL